MAFLFLSFALCASAFTPAIKWIDCRDQIPFTPDPATIDVTSIPSTLHCGHLTVPMDYNRPHGLNITLGVAMYRSKSPQGVIFFNPGGTDESTTFVWPTAFNTSAVFSGLEEFDIFTMDGRGTYNSNPLNVSLDVFNGMLGPFPKSVSEFEAIRNASAKTISSWMKNSSPPSIIQFVGTREVVQDYEMARRSLRYDKVHFVGASYGSYRAVSYAAAYPNHVSRIVLDAVTPHGINVSQEALAQINAVNRGLLRADAYCLNNSTCPVHHKGAIVKAYHDTLAAAPLPASLCTNGTLCKAPILKWQIQQGFANSLLGTPDFPQIIGSLVAATHGDGSLFGLAALDPFPSVPAAWAMPLEYFGTNDFKAFNASFNAAEKFDTNNIASTSFWHLQLWCSAWSWKTQPAKALPLKNVSMLMVTANFDNDTPTEFAREIWAQNGKSTLIIRHGDDHVSFTHPEFESTLLTKEYLRTGQMPTPRNKEFISVYSAGMQLRPIADPYQVPTEQLREIDDEAILVKESLYDCKLVLAST